MCLLYESFSPPPNKKIGFREQTRLFRGAYVVTDLLLPRLKSNNFGLTQTLVKLGCQIPNHVFTKSLHNAVPLSGLDATTLRRRNGRAATRACIHETL